MLVCLAPFLDRARSLRREGFLSPVPIGWVDVWVGWMSNSLNSLTSIILIGLTSCFWTETMRIEHKLLEPLLYEFSGLSLSAVIGVLSENFRRVFFRRLLLISFSLEKFVRSVGELLSLRVRLNLMGLGMACLGLACVSIQLLISHETTFLLLDLKSNQKRDDFSGEQFIFQLIQFQMKSKHWNSKNVPRLSFGTF